MKKLSREHKSAWVSAYVGVHRVSRSIERVGHLAGVVPLEVYDVLLVLEDSEDMKMRLGDLAEAVLLSRSGITRMVDRLEKQGYVKRVPCGRDRRVNYAVLTPFGLEERRRAWPVYEAALAEHFAPHLSSEEASAVAELMGRMVPPADRHESEEESTVVVGHGG